jgi:hypothetical protein
LAASVKALPVYDPYSLSSGIKTSEELSVLRKRKAGKELTKYYEKQNEASLLGLLMIFEYH